MDKHSVDYYAYSELRDKVNELLSERENRKVNIRDYGGKYTNTGLDSTKAYLDFWHYWLDYVDEEVKNDSFSFAELGKKAPKGKEWMQPIIDAFLEVCPELEDGVLMWYSW